MVIVLALHVEGQGSIPGRVEALGMVLANHSLTTARCNNGTSECREDRNQRVPELSGMFGDSTVPIYLKVMAYTKVG